MEKLKSDIPVIPPELPPIPPYRTFHCGGGETKESKLLTEEYNRKSEQWNKYIEEYNAGNKKLTEWDKCMAKTKQNPLLEDYSLHHQR